MQNKHNIPIIFVKLYKIFRQEIDSLLNREEFTKELNVYFRYWNITQGEKKCFQKIVPFSSPLLLLPLPLSPVANSIMTINFLTKQVKLVKALTF